MKKILVVEDDSGIRESLLDILQISGYDVLTASNGKEGFQIIMDESPDLVVCDVNMPVINGYELLGALNQRMQDEILPSFIFLTAKVDQKDIRYGMNLGADDYVTKPFNHNELLSIIKMRIEKREKISGLNQQQQTKEVVEKINHELNETVNTSKINKLAIPTSDGLQFVPFDDIIRCEADRSYCNIHVINNVRLTVSKPLKEFEEILLANQFIKIHKSHIINLTHITKYIRSTSSYIVMSDRSTPPVSTRKKEEVLELLKSV